MRGSTKKEGGTWMYIVDLPRGPEGKRRQQKRRGFATRKAAEAALADVLTEVQRGTRVEPTKLTLSAFMSGHWFPVVEDRVRESTYDSYARNYRLHLEPYLGSVPLQNLTPAMLNGLYRELAEKGLSPKTIRHVHTVARKAFRDAMRWGFLHRNPADASDPPRVERREMETWSAAEVRRFLHEVESDLYRCLFTVFCTTGMRRGEVLGLRWKDVDLSAGRLSVQQTLTSVNYKLVFGQPKTNRGRRSVPIDLTTCEVLRQQRKRWLKSRRTMGIGWQGDHDLVFTNPDGSPLHPDVVSDAFQRMNKLSGLPKIRLHDLRHTWATLALEERVPVKVVSEVLGHASPAFTLDIYSHVTPVMMEDLARVVGETIFLSTDSSNAQSN